MTLKLQRLIRRPATERGFTLIELLVVIIILGILAAVVVFAVSGVGDKGKSSATTIDERTIRTAQEAYCAQNSRYASGQELVDGRFLSELPEYHQVNAQANQGGPCNGWKFTILRTAQADPYPAGQWDLVSPSPGLNTVYLVRLADGRVLAGGADASGSTWVTQIWDPVTGTWTTVGSPPDLPANGSTAILLTDDPGTPQNECKGAVVDNCGKVFVYGKYLYDPLYPAAGHPLEWQTLLGPAECRICNSGPSNFTSGFGYVEMKTNRGPCGTTCGRIYMFPSSPTPFAVDVFNPADNSYTTAVLNQQESVASRFLTQLPDGRIHVCCRDNSSGGRRALFFDPVSLAFIGDDTQPPIRWHRNGASQPGIVLPNGDVLFTVHAGSTSSGLTGIYTPQSGGLGSFRTVPRCATTFHCYPVASLPDGRVLFSLTFSGARADTVETYVYNPATSTWSRTDDLNNRLSYNTKEAVVLDPARGPCGSHCGKVLVSGQGSAELYTP